MSQIPFIGTYKERLKKAVIEILSFSGIDQSTMSIYMGMIGNIIDQQPETEAKTTFERLQLIFAEPKIKENPLL